MKTSVVDDAPALNRDEKPDVVIVGLGIAGMSVAYELAKAGKDVVMRASSRLTHGCAICCPTSARKSTGGRARSWTRSIIADSSAAPTDRSSHLMASL